jgi:hypothetical protein
MSTAAAQITTNDHQLRSNVLNEGGEGQLYRVAASSIDSGASVSSRAHELARDVCSSSMTSGSMSIQRAQSKVHVCTNGLLRAYGRRTVLGAA